MKRFAFRLQPLLNYKAYRERLAQQDTAKAHMDIVNCEKQIADLKARLLATEDSMEKQIEKGVTAAVFQQHYAYVGAVASAIQLEKNRKKDLEKVYQEKLVVLKKRTIEKKTMDRLREKQAIAYGQEILQSEQKDLDEICALKSAREITNDTN